MTDDNGEFCSIAFKLWSDPFVGKTVFFRVLFQAPSAKATPVYTYRARTNVSGFSRLIQDPAAHNAAEFETWYSGDIAAMGGIKNITTGDTLCAGITPIFFRTAIVPDPVISMAIETEDGNWDPGKKMGGTRWQKRLSKRPDFPRLHVTRTNGQGTTSPGG